MDAPMCKTPPPLLLPPSAPPAAPLPPPAPTLDVVDAAAAAADDDDDDDDDDDGDMRVNEDVDVSGSTTRVLTTSSKSISNDSLSTTKYKNNKEIVLAPSRDDHASYQKISQGNKSKKTQSMYKRRTAGANKDHRSKLGA